MEVSHISLFPSLSKSTFILTALGVSEEVPGGAGDGSGVLQNFGLDLQVSQLNANLRFCGNRATSPGYPTKPSTRPAGLQTAPSTVLLSFSLF